MSIIATCPACGTKGPVSAFLAEAEYKEALIAALRMPPQISSSVILYIGLFAPTSGRAIGANKLNRVITELVDLITSAEVTCNRVTHRAPVELWGEALEAVFQARDAGTLNLPLDDHRYLSKIVWSLAGRRSGTSHAGAPTVTHPSHRPAAQKADTSADAADLRDKIRGLDTMIGSADTATKTILRAQQAGYKRRLKALEGGDEPG